MNSILQKIFSYFSPLVREYRDLVLGVLFAILAMAWAFALGILVTGSAELNPSHRIGTLSSVAVAIGVITAIWKLISDQEWRKSEVYLEQSLDLLEKSYSQMHESANQNQGYPLADRLLWLSAARLLLAGQDLGLKISDESHRETYIEYSDYWRIKFRDLLQFHGQRSPSFAYFHNDSGDPIARESILVFYRFVQWPKDMPDRLGLVPPISGEEIPNMAISGARETGRFLTTPYRPGPLLPP